MFISNLEKSGIQSSLKNLQGQISNLMFQISEMSEEIKALKARNPLKLVKPKKTKVKTPLVKTAEAPWGFKLDGTPRKQPGRVQPKPAEAAAPEEVAA